MSSPDCSDRWKCGISRGSPAISSNKASSISMLSSEDRRRRFEARHGGEQALAKLPEPAFVAGDVDAGEDDFLRALVELRARPRRGSPRTASTGSARAPARSSRRCSDGRSRSGPRRSCGHGPGSPADTRRLREILELDPVDLGHRAKALRLELGRASGDEDLRIGPLAARAADRLPGLPHRLGRHRAAVDDDPVLARGRKRLHRLALGEVEPAAEGDRFDAHAKAARSISPLNT